MKRAFTVGKTTVIVLFYSYNAYVEKCKNAGYDNNAVTEDGMYAADNGVYTLVLSMADDNVMNISMNVVE